MPSTEEEIRDAFKVFDKDNDGFITSDELKRILTKVYTSLNLFASIARYFVDEFSRQYFCMLLPALILRLLFPLLLLLQLDMD